MRPKIEGLSVLILTILFWFVLLLLALLTIACVVLLFTDKGDGPYEDI